MALNIELLKKICETPGAPGYEKPIREVILRELDGLADEVKIDNMGNVSAIRKGKSEQKVMIAAHMDEIGFMVKHIDENGFLRFHPLGGFDPKTLTAQRVIVHGKEDVTGVMGTKPIHIMDDEERKKLPRIKDYFIDLGLPREEVEKVISIGDPVTRERELIEMGECVNGKSIDNRISVFILIEVLRELKGKEVPFEIHGVFTVQEEVGIRGVTASALEIQPYYGFGLDTTIAFDTPGASPDEKITELGKGAAIKIMDASAICDPRMVEFMKKTADDHKVPWQPEIMVAGGTDTAGIQKMNAGGAITGALSIPTRHLHQVIEMAHKSDISHCVDLLTACLQELDKIEA